MRLAARLPVGWTERVPPLWLLAADALALVAFLALFARWASLLGSRGVTLAFEARGVRRTDLRRASRFRLPALRP